MLWQALKESGCRWPGTVVAGDVQWDLGSCDALGPGIYKTHDYPAARMPEQLLHIYVFGNPAHAAQSALLQASRDSSWWPKHCEHLRAPLVPPERLLVDDALRFADHFDAWMRHRSSPVAFVRFESHCENSSQLSRYVGFDVRLPVRRKRSAPADDNDLPAYTNLRTRLEALPDWFVLNGEERT